MGATWCNLGPKRLVGTPKRCLMLLTSGQLGPNLDPKRLVGAPKRCFMLSKSGELVPNLRPAWLN